MVVNGHGTGLFLAYGRCGTTCVMNKTRLEDARSIDSSSEEDVEREELQSIDCRCWLVFVLQIFVSKQFEVQDVRGEETVVDQLLCSVEFIERNTTIVPYIMYI